MKCRLALNATKHVSDIKGATVIRQWKDCLHWLNGFRNVLLAPTSIVPPKYYMSFGELVASLDLHFNLPTPSVEFLHIKRTLEMPDELDSKNDTWKPYYQTLGTAMKTANLLIKFNADLKLWKWEQVIMKLHHLKWHILASFRPEKWYHSLDDAQRKEVDGLEPNYDFYDGQMSKALGSLQTKFNLSSTEAQDLVDWLRGTNAVQSSAPKKQVDYSCSPFAKVSKIVQKSNGRKKRRLNVNYYPEARDMVFVKTKLIQFSDEGFQTLKAMQQREKLQKRCPSFETPQTPNSTWALNIGSWDYISDERESDSMNEREEIKRIYMHGGSPGGDSILSNSPSVPPDKNSEKRDLCTDTNLETPINKRLKFKERIMDVDTNPSKNSRLWVALNSGNSNEICPWGGGTPMFAFPNQQNRNSLFSPLAAAISPVELPVVEECKDFLNWPLEKDDKCISEEKYKYFQIQECKIVWTKQVQKAFKDWLNVYWDSGNKVYSGNVNEAAQVNARGRVRTSIDIAYDAFFQRDKTYVELFIKLKSGEYEPIQIEQMDHETSYYVQFEHAFPSNSDIKIKVVDKNHRLLGECEVELSTIEHQASKEGFELELTGGQGGPRSVEGITSWRTEMNVFNETSYTDTIVILAAKTLPLHQQEDKRRNHSTPSVSFNPEHLPGKTKVTKARSDETLTIETLVQTKGIVIEDMKRTWSDLSERSDFDQWQEIHRPLTYPKRSSENPGALQDFELEEMFSKTRPSFNDMGNGSQYPSYHAENSALANELLHDDDTRMFPKSVSRKGEEKYALPGEQCRRNWVMHITRSQISLQSAIKHRSNQILLGWHDAYVQGWSYNFLENFNEFCDELVAKAERIADNQTMSNVLNPSDLHTPTNERSRPAIERFDIPKMEEICYKVKICGRLVGTKAFIQPLDVDQGVKMDTKRNEIPLSQLTYTKNTRVRILNDKRSGFEKADRLKDAVVIRENVDGTFNLRLEENNRELKNIRYVDIKPTEEESTKKAVKDSLMQRILPGFNLIFSYIYDYDVGSQGIKWIPWERKAACDNHMDRDDFEALNFLMPGKKGEETKEDEQWWIPLDVLNYKSKGAGREEHFSDSCSRLKNIPLARGQTITNNIKFYLPNIKGDMDSTEFWNLVDVVRGEIIHVDEDIINDPSSSSKPEVVKAPNPEDGETGHVEKALIPFVRARLQEAIRRERTHKTENFGESFPIHVVSFQMDSVAWNMNMTDGNFRTELSDFKGVYAFLRDGSTMMDFGLKSATMVDEVIEPEKCDERYYRRSNHKEKQTVRTILQSHPAILVKDNHFLKVRVELFEPVSQIVNNEKTGDFVVNIGNISQYRLLDVKTCPLKIDITMSQARHVMNYFGRKWLDEDILGDKRQKFAAGFQNMSKGVIPKDYQLMNGSRKKSSTLTSQTSEEKTEADKEQLSFFHTVRFESVRIEINFAKWNLDLKNAALSIPAFIKSTTFSMPLLLKKDELWSWNDVAKEVISHAKTAAFQCLWQGLGMISGDQISSKKNQRKVKRTLLGPSQAGKKMMKMHNEGENDDFELDFIRMVLGKPYSSSVENLVKFGRCSLEKKVDPEVYLIASCPDKSLVIQPGRFKVKDKFTLRYNNEFPISKNGQPAQRDVSFQLKEPSFSVRNLPIKLSVILFKGSGLRMSLQFPKKLLEFLGGEDMTALQNEQFLRMKIHSELLECLATDEHKDREGDSIVVKEYEHIRFGISCKITPMPCAIVYARLAKDAENPEQVWWAVRRNLETRVEHKQWPTSLTWLPMLLADKFEIKLIEASDS